MTRQLCTLLICCAAFATANGRLEFDSKANRVQIYGPYLKYNVLKPPYSIGQYQFSLSDINLTVESGTSNEDSDPTLLVRWPRFLMSYGQLRIINKRSKRKLLEINFTENQLGSDDKFAQLELEGEGASLLSNLGEPFQICLDQKFEMSFVKACSDYLIFKENQITTVFNGKNASFAKLNGKKTPANSQVSLDQSARSVRFEFRFKSGFSLFVRDKVHKLDQKNVAIDPVERRIGVISGDGSIRPSQLTLKDRFFSFIKEKNDIRNSYQTSKDWPQNIENTEMEFSPYQTGASIQLYGVIMPSVPPPFQFKLDDDIPIATYSKSLELHGTKAESEILAARVKNELFIHENNKEFLWNFPANEAGVVNQNYLSLQHKGKDYYFSKRIFRAHQTSISAAAAISTSPTLDFVPGYNVAAEHWFESVWGKGNYSFQRWGIAANLYETIQGFLPKDNFPEKISVNPITFDVLYRFNAGVRPVQSSFGLGIRYLNFTLFRSKSEDINTQLLGIGAFWHTAPQKIVDDIFNIVPFFRYPKWMEISFFYYPLLIGTEKVGFSFSWQARGKMFFAKNWFLDASFNVNNIAFTKAKLAGVTLGADTFSIGTAHGTLGVGYNFN